MDELKALVNRLIAEGVSYTDIECEVSEICHQAWIAEMDREILAGEMREEQEYLTEGEWHPVNRG